MYNELPILNETVTAGDRLQALKDARDLIAGEAPKGGFFQTLAGDNGKTGAGAKSVTSLIRLAEYITTGHDYQDTHPHGQHFEEALTLEKYQAKRHRKDHEEHHRHHDGPRIEVHEIPVPRHIAERLLNGDLEPEEMINLLREYHESPKGPSGE